MFLLKPLQIYDFFLKKQKRFLDFSCWVVALIIDHYSRFSSHFSWGVFLTLPLGGLYLCPTNLIYTPS